VEFVAAFTGREFHEFHEKNLSRLDVIGLKYNSSPSLRRAAWLPLL